MSIPAGEPKAKRGLNFSGEQKIRVMAAAGSSNTQARSGRTGAYSRRRGREEDLAESDVGENSQQESHSRGREEVNNNLAKSVEDMAVETGVPDLNAAPPSSVGKGKVSGLDSFVGSGGSSFASGADQGEGNLSMLERLTRAKQRDFLESQQMKAPCNPCKFTENGGQEGHITIAKEGESPAKRSRLSSTMHANLTGSQAGTRQEQ
ncbi:unnamed protein product [Urochloa humidicola]